MFPLLKSLPPKSLEITLNECHYHIEEHLQAGYDLWVTKDSVPTFTIPSTH
jgi:hypothetical protein